MGGSGGAGWGGTLLESASQAPVGGSELFLQVEHVPLLSLGAWSPLPSRSCAGWKNKAGLMLGPSPPQAPCDGMSRACFLTLSVGGAA